MPRCGGTARARARRTCARDDRGKAVVDSLEGVQAVRGVPAHGHRHVVPRAEVGERRPHLCEPVQCARLDGVPLHLQLHVRARRARVNVHLPCARRRACDTRVSARRARGGSRAAAAAAYIHRKVCCTLADSSRISQDSCTAAGATSAKITMPGGGDTRATRQPIQKVKANQRISRAPQ